MLSKRKTKTLDSKVNEKSSWEPLTLVSTQFTIDEVSHLLLQSIEKDNLPIISVGSGNGVDEYNLEQKINRKIICIDPEPEKFTKYPENKKYIPAHFSTVEQMLALHKSYYEKTGFNMNENVKLLPENLINNCHLLIIWPFNNNDSDGFYDIKSIFDLNPKTVIIVYSTDKSSGSYTLRTWLNFISKANDLLENIKLYTEYYPKSNYMKSFEKTIDLKGEWTPEKIDHAINCAILANPKFKDVILKFGQIKKNTKNFSIKTSRTLIKINRVDD